MGQTVIASGSALARKLYSVAAFANMQRQASFAKTLIGAAPKQPDAEAKLKGQTSSDFPVVRVTDLSKTAGDSISVDSYNIIGGKPTMGDRKLAGRMTDLTFSSMDIKINQVRHGVDPGGRMSQQRTLHNLRSIGMANLTGWWNRYQDQALLTHIGGARGFQTGSDWIVPLESDPEFSEIMVNTVLPPSPTRKFFCNDATTASDVGTNDGFTLTDIDRLRAKIDEMPFPPQPIRLPNDPAVDEEPLYCLYVTSRQWNQIQTSTVANNNWRTFLANAYERGRFTNHPLFMGTTGMWNGILVKKMRRAIRFPTGSTVREYAVDGVTINNVTAAVDIDRAILLGAQAAALVYGKNQRSDYYFSWNEETSDHGNTTEISLAAMMGMSKLKFTDFDGNPVDQGVIVMDGYAPAP
jgi:N4-gp56 family major capsid protein